MQAKQKRQRAARERRVNRLRNGVIGFAVLVAAVVAGYGLLYSSGATDSGEIVEGEHYRVIDDPMRRRPGAPIVVTEFFSYGCIHCRNFEPLVAGWQRDLPDDVRFERAPVSFNAAWALLAQAYFALEAAGGLEANHERFFRAIHDNGRQFLSGTTSPTLSPAAGWSARRSWMPSIRPRCARRQAERNALARRFEIAGTPTMVVAGRYAVTMDAGRRQALKTVDHLIGLERGRGGDPGASRIVDPPSSRVPRLFL